MPNKTSNDQTAVLVAIKKLGSSLMAEIRKGDKLLRQEILKVEERVEDLEGGQKRIEVKVNKISIQLDGFVGKVEALEQENSLGVKQYRDHEKRISKLESRVVQPA